MSKLGFVMLNSKKLQSMTTISASKKSRWDSCEADFVEFYGPDDPDAYDAKNLLAASYRDLPGVVGNLVHKALEIAAVERLKLYDEILKEDADTPAIAFERAKSEALELKVTQEELLSCFDEAIKSPDRFSGLYPTDSQVTRAAAEILIKAVKHVNFKHLAVDRQRKRIVEGEHRVNLGEVAPGVTGWAPLFIDRVDEPRPGEIVIVDYKTGHQEITSEEAEWDPQTTLYLVAAHDLFPDAKSWTIELRYLTSGRSAWADWTPVLDWWTRSTFRETLRRIRTQRKFAERPGWQCRGCFRRKVCGTYQAYLAWDAPKTAVDKEPLDQLANEYHDIDTRVSMFKSRQAEIEARFYSELAKVRQACEKSPNEASLLVSKWTLKSVLSSNRTNYDAQKVMDAWIDAGLKPQDLLQLMSVAQGKLEDLVEAIPDQTTRRKLWADLELVGQKNSFKKLVWKENPQMIQAPSGAES